MMEAAQYSFSMLLFLLLFLFFHTFFSTLLSAQGKKARLSYRHRHAWTNKANHYLTRYGGVYRHISDMLETVRWRMQPTSFFILSAVLLLAGMCAGALLFSGARGMLTLSFMLTFIPFLVLKMKLISMQVKTRMEFLPAVEIFYQHYVLGGQRNMRVVLQQILREERLVYPMKPVFDQLHRNLSTNRDIDDSLRIFTMSLGHEWAKYFANVFAVGLREGVDVTESLKELISDMRTRERADQAERNHLLEIRIANFSPIGFLAVFLWMNYKLDPTQAVHYYLLSAEGRHLILDALLLIFLSFLMGVYLSLKRM